MMDIINWIQANVVQIFLAWGALLGFLQIAVRFTPTKRDDRWVSKIGSVVEMLRNLVSGQKPTAASKDQQK